MQECFLFFFNQMLFFLSLTSATKDAFNLMNILVIANNSWHLKNK